MNAAWEHVAVAICAWSVLGGSAAMALTDAEPGGLRAYRLEHQSAGDALPMVQDLLSESGTVQLQSAENTLVVRDTGDIIATVSEFLAAFDHPRRELGIELHLVEAGSLRPGEPPPAPLPGEVGQRLTRLLRYEAYRLLGTSRWSEIEGRSVKGRVAGRFQASFRVGTVLPDGSVRLHGFKLWSEEGENLVELVHTHLNLSLDRPLVLGLVRDENSNEALMMVVTCREGDR